MSKIIKANVDWMETWANSPRLIVLFDSEPVFKYQESNGLYLAIDGDAANYIYWSGEGNTGGFGGRTFELDMIDGSKRELLGPWSSRAECISREFPETPITEASICNDPMVFERGYTFTAAAVTIESLKGRALPLVTHRDIAVSEVAAKTAFIALMSDGSYDLVIKEHGHEWLTKDMWVARRKGWHRDGRPDIAVVFTGEQS